LYRHISVPDIFQLTVRYWYCTPSLARMDIGDDDPVDREKEVPPP